MLGLKKINLNSIADLRTATDNELAAVFQQLGYDESFALTDTKLALGVSTVAIAAALFAIDKKFTFKESYTWTVIAIAVYFIISCVLYILTNKPDLKNVKYIGYKKQDKITVAGSTKGYDPEYHIKLTQNGQSVSASLPFTKFFDITGYLNRDALLELVKAQLEKFEKKHQ